MKLKGKCALITGGSQGLGKVIAKTFVQEGASVMLCARNREPLLAAQSELSCDLGRGQRVLAQTADLSETSQADRLLEKTLHEFPDLDILINNAGIYGPIGPLEENSWKEWAETIRINLLAAVYVCRYLAGHFKKRRQGKIINISGGGAAEPRFGFTAYAASKAAIVRFTETLAEELRAYHVDVNAVSPGALKTRLLDQVLEAGPGKIGSAAYEKAVKQKGEGSAVLEKASSLCVFLASRASDGITGRLISAVWDPWERLEERCPELQETDIYTLRRILPKDRGKSWVRSSR